MTDVQPAILGRYDAAPRIASLVLRVSQRRRAAVLVLPATEPHRRVSHQAQLPPIISPAKSTPAHRRDRPPLALQTARRDPIRVACLGDRRRVLHRAAALSCASVRGRESAERLGVGVIVVCRLSFACRWVFGTWRGRGRMSGCSATCRATPWMCGVARSCQFLEPFPLWGGV